jgi:hypothetical protein
MKYACSDLQLQQRLMFFFWTDFVHDFMHCVRVALGDKTRYMANICKHSDRVLH